MTARLALALAAVIFLTAVTIAFLTDLRSQT